MALKRIIQKHGIKLTLIALLLGGTAYIFGSPPKYEGYKPDQPIPFSHKIHAGELNIDCRFCHTGVERSQHATVPDTATCIKCHESVGSDSAHIQFLRESYKRGEPLRWNKVHDLPDHVRFSHKPHIAKGFECSTCHGPVETMDKVEVTAPFNMGWCVNCHRDYTYGRKGTLGIKTADGKLNPDRLQMKEPGPNTSVSLTDCSVCHY